MSEAENKVVKIDSQMKAKAFRNTGVPADKGQGNPPSLRSLRVEAEIYAISRTLEYTNWNRRKAAQLLSISYRGILYKIRQHGLSPRPRTQAEPAEMLKADSQG
ncbi:MAG TPA: helix-turn-helix domain-containing protein [Candidatus Acidoferrum sp.]|jgi:DNA-binding NtrC family response regulator|nr:helix-turn-helix domain-containing protein [Candidatus Acidoferrum sp.]